MSKSARSRRTAWNRGKIVGQKPPLKIKEVWAIRVRLQLAERSRDLALFNLAIDSKLRGCDVVKVGVEDVLLSGTLRSRASVVQKKTGKPVTFEITEQTRSAIQGWLHRLGGRQRDPLFPSRLNPKRSISTRQYARLVDSWVASIGPDPSVYGTHSLRRTKATLIYRRTGNLRAVQLLLGHAKLESTVRYLGIEVEDALAIAEQVDV
jgi:integrase